MSDAPATAGGDRLAPGTVPALIAMGLAIFVIANDVTAMSVALPAIEAAFDTDVSTVQWVVSAYALIFGVLIVTGGRLADMFGRRRILFIGAGTFALFSLVGGVAPSIWVLIAARALMGIGGALMWPAILGLVYAILPPSRAGLAGGLVIGIAGVGNAAGPMLGGVLTQTVGWRWILFLNVPIAAVASAVTWRTVPADAPTERAAIDHAGIASLSLGLIALLVALGQAPTIGWTSPFVLAMLGLCVTLLVLFALRERRAGDDGLVPPSVIGNGRFLSACIVIGLMSATFFASLLYLPQYLQKILGADPLAAGAGLLPLMGTFALVSFGAGALIRKVGMKAVVTVGAALLALGPLIIVAMVHPDSGFATFVPGMVVLGVGVGLFYSSVTTAGVTALDPSRSSLAGGILYMFQVAGGAIGLGLTTTIFLVGSNAGLDDEVTNIGVTLTGDEQVAVRGVLVGTDSANVLIARFSGTTASQLVELVRTAFVSGLRWALLVDGVLAVVAFVITAWKVAGPLSRFGRDADDDAAAGSSAAGA
ncbi:MAG: DHA2 family efflux MFS transporter permease subunit [Acidimicrobiales bacterium]